MKIAFFLPNKNIQSVDCKNVEMGNPGIGGSEYSAILIAASLCRKGNLDVVLLTEEDGIFPVGLKWVKCKSLESTIKYVIENRFNYLVVDGKFLTEYIVLKYHNVNFLAWANTFIPPGKWGFLARHSNINKVVNVGKEELEQTKAHLGLYKKSCYVYNAVPTDILAKYPGLKPNKQRKANVVYIGSLIPSKGFHLLAKAWNVIIKEVPEAQLYVIGSGKLYGRGRKLGKWNIADDQYEEEFMPYLTSGGKVLPSVHFLGIMGDEKYDILSECKVGVPNPSGVSKTFGYTAVEMEFMDCEVVTIKCPGYLDTVCKKENLYDNPDDLADKVISLLKSQSDDYLRVLSYIDRFSVKAVVAAWEKLFFSLSPLQDTRSKVDKVYDAIKLCGLEVYKVTYLALRCLYRKTIKNKLR